MTHLAEPLIAAAAASPDAAAVIAPDGIATYGELDQYASQAASLLRALGVAAGDRVGIYAPKGVRALAFMQGTLRLGAAYVPVDLRSPAPRAAAAFTACAASAVVGRSADLERLVEAVRPPGVPLGDASPAASDRREMRLVAIDESAPGLPCWTDVLAQSSVTPARPAGSEHDLAYILFTSGSTGPPKGVCISHRNALSFVEWGVGLIAAGPDDCFANHASYNFDLSVFDIYGAFVSRARLVTIPESTGVFGPQLVDLCRRHAITVWYSVPTALMLMLRAHGFTAGELPHLRAVLFAGEVFPIAALRTLRQTFPNARLFNWYGPTETNVCTSYEVRDVPESCVTPVPIGVASCGDRVWAETGDGRMAAPGEEGELLVEGPTVALGYWGHPFASGAPYRTGDCVRVLDDGGFAFVGRLDRMVKLRGCRIEPGEVEAALVSHPAIAEAAVFVRGEGPEARLAAVLVAAPGQDPPPLLQIKQHCAARLPPYMAVAEAGFVDCLPRTPNGKIDYQRLQTSDAIGDAGGLAGVAREGSV